MIYIFIGSSCAGKSTIVDNTFLKGKRAKEYKDLVAITETEDCFLIGKYLVDKRVRGADIISRADIPKLPEQILKLLPYGRDIVIEGYKINSPLLDELIVKLAECKMFLVKSSLYTSLKRNAKNGATAGASHFKAVATKADNMFWRYERFMSGEIIDTESVTDWEGLTLATCKRIRPWDNTFADWYRFRAEYVAMKDSKVICKGRDYVPCFFNVIARPDCMKVWRKGEEVEARMLDDCAAPKMLNEKWRKA